MHHENRMAVKVSLQMVNKLSAIKSAVIISFDLLRKGENNIFLSIASLLLYLIPFLKNNRTSAFP